MKRQRLEDLTVAQLVERYPQAGIEEDKAEKEDEFQKRNTLCRQMFAIANELKRRPGDQRRALVPLFDHPNIEVRLLAAKAALAIAPVEARKVIEEIAASRRFPYAGDAGMCLNGLDKGQFVPSRQPLVSDLSF